MGDGRTPVMQQHRPPGLPYLILYKDGEVVAAGTSQVLSALR